MANISISISYDTSCNGRDPNNYRVSMDTIAGLEVSEIMRDGPVWNGVVRYEGVFGTERDAIDAALRYIGMPCVIAEYVDVLSEEHRIYVERHNTAKKFGFGWKRHVLGSRSHSGVFVRVG